ncbi:hypothetical protein [Saccharothrix obliqua]|uniref:hypothetical protein n=1 Tax=Saccharothrix obliqua TaxID=2861747 RepID=UPI001C607E3E|nr:hypothetical protein [Saccharothrix obliqua]MBW4720610.1 hypothetical protein [Saccharothrix obliqua]
MVVERDAAGGAPPPRVTADELLDLREKQWSARLRGCSLVAELEVKDEHARQAAKALGRVYAKWRSRGHPDRVFARWPACVAVALTGIAAREYRQGELWPEVWRNLGYDGEQQDRTFWGQGFHTAVRHLGMPDFPEMRTKYVGPVLMHTGIPNYCLDDYFRLVAQRRAIDPDLDPEGFLDWATAVPTRLDVLDVPARRFLEHGSDYALDFLGRTFDLLDRLGDPTPDNAGLPARVVVRARELASSGGLSVRSGSHRRVERPRIGLDPFGRGIEVILPATGDAVDGAALWAVTADGVTRTVRSQAPWEGVAESVPPAAFTLLQPVRTVVAAREGSGDRTELTVVDAKSPLLAFTADGRRLAASIPLPPDDVWLVHPDEYELVADGPLRITVEGQLPLGWTGWRLRQVRLADVRSLELAGITATRRFVRGYPRPRIEVGGPVAGVTTPYGTPVHADLPAIWLPGRADAETTWTVELRRSGDDTPVLSTTRTVRAPHSVTGVWDDLPRPVLGSFDITVRGPLGRGVSRTVFVAEGLGSRFAPAARVFAGRGLVRGRAELVAPVGAGAVPGALDFAPEVRAGVVEYRTGTETEPLVVTPPHLQVMHEQADQSLAWSAGPLRIAADLFADHPGVLLVRVPGVGEVPPLRVVVSGAVVQTVPPSGRSRGTARYDLVRIADTVAEHHSAELALDLGGTSVRVASIRPRRLARGVRRVEEHLRLVEPVLVEGLTAGIYATTAPWRGPTAVPVAGDIPLPAELRHAGPLLVELRVDDPWVPAEWPDWPEQFVVVPGEGHLVGEDPEEEALSRFVAGVGPFPADIRDLRRLWALIHLAPRLRAARDVAAFRETCAEPLRRSTIDALEALVALRLSPEQTATAVISAGLASSGVPGGHHAEAARRLWSLSPLAGVLVAAAADEDWLDAARRQCGDCVDVIVAEGRDPHAGVGRFGPETAALTTMPVQQLEGVWRAARVVPHGLLDADSRAVAARRLFDRRDDDRVRDVGRSTTTWLPGLVELVADRPVLRAQVAARTPPPGRTGWWGIPALSAAFAVVARLAARGVPACVAVEREFRQTWAELAGIAPEMAVLDLVVAELLIARAEGEQGEPHPGLTGDQ